MTRGFPISPRTAGTIESRARRGRLDRWARRAIALGGVCVIGALLAIFVVVVVETWPLLQGPKAWELGAVPVKAPALAAGEDEYRQVAYVVGSGGPAFYSLADGSSIEAPPPPALAGARVTSVSLPRGKTMALGLSDGRLLPVRAAFATLYQDSGRTVAPAFEWKESLSLAPAGIALTRIAYAETPDGPLAAAAAGGKEIYFARIEEQRSLLGPSGGEVSRWTLFPPMEGAVSALALDERGENLIVGTSAGDLIRYDLQQGGEPQPGESLPQACKGAVSILGYALGDRTLVAGDSSGGVSSWQVVRQKAGPSRLTKIYDYAVHSFPVTGFSASPRNKSFLTLDSKGRVQLHYGTTGETLLSADLPGPAAAVAYAPKADGFSAVGASGEFRRWGLENAHPESSWRSFFGKVWYENYPGPAYVWQSTGGTDDFESKFSLIPLLLGTIKGTFYALFFAVPLALLAALYASQFMHPSLKAYVKPAVEIMAALPSVVLGFVAGLWLAPALEKILPAIPVYLLTMPLLVLLAVFAWRGVPERLRHGLRPGAELVLLLPIVAGTFAVSIWLGRALEHSLLSGDYRSWLQALGLTYDQRNSVVVGIAMGFAVLPVIFTIAEDSLSNVPPHLSAGSLALGATRWQTAVRVVLPTASPGIFSAIMIGFGRAVGETMIVLMATGNTPILNFSPFTGFRALSANLAVELPEAAVGSTHYRVLFLAALLLFVLTFVANTAAEMVRLKLRRRYRAYA